MSGSWRANQITRLHEDYVEELKSKGAIQSPRVEEAFRSVPRHLFLPDVRQVGNGRAFGKSLQ